MSKSEQRRADALADAETLWNVHRAYAGLEQDGCDCIWFVDVPGSSCPLRNARAWGSVAKLSFHIGQDWAGWAEEAARAAFRAVPGLRGEEEK